MCGTPSGTKAPSPGPATIRPSGVSTHIRPATLCHASDPGWRCTLLGTPGGETPSMYWAT